MTDGQWIATGSIYIVFLVGFIVFVHLVTRYLLKHHRQEAQRMARRTLKRYYGFWWL